MLKRTKKNGNILCSMSLPKNCVNFGDNVKKGCGKDLELQTAIPSAVKALEVKGSSPPRQKKLTGSRKTKTSKANPLKDSNVMPKLANASLKPDDSRRKKLTKTLGDKKETRNKLDQDKLQSLVQNVIANDYKEVLNKFPGQYNLSIGKIF